MKRERIGSVTVDSGRLIILDPCYFDQRPLGLEHYRALCMATPRRAGPAFAEIAVAEQGASAVVTVTPPAAKSFSVFADIADDGELLRIVIDFIPQAATP